MHAKCVSTGLRLIFLVFAQDISSLSWRYLSFSSTLL